MLSNSLTRDMGLKVGPVMLGTLIKHYFDRVKVRESADLDKLLRQDEILYDEAFNIIKSFLHESTFHTVEELQGFSNTQTPSSPWTHLVRVIVPLSSCDEAATYLVKALGGGDKAREVVGGVKWWQVRGIEGVDAQWITAKKDWREAKRRHKLRQDQTLNTTNVPQPSQQQSDPVNNEPNGTYEKYMDEMRCILYLHGGGYYFGSVDQERYSVQRHARKVNGRVFAINYRLAPQYPFPCGLQDCLAAYLYLIRPPPGADHSPIKPAHIVIAGDSAGGGMSLALLQVLRDAELPLPAGGVLISPWCDLTHSFPSVHTNTSTDILPPTGLSLHKPSILWPPPSHDESVRVHRSLRQRLRYALKMDENPAPVQAGEPVAKTSLEARSIVAPDMPIDVGGSIPVPSVDAVDPQTLALKTDSGEELKVDQQVHFYAQNSLLVHPLVSPALAYLGGLPPLFFIAGDKEVLRDEIIYTAHKAANPHNYTIQDQTRSLYPSLEGVEKRHPKPTAVHLQVYDGACHVLPVLFLFSTPAKYCYRAMASFVKLVTGMPLAPPVSASDSSIPKMSRPASLPDIQRAESPEQLDSLNPPPLGERQLSSASAPASGHSSGNNTPNSSPPVTRKQSLRRALSTKVAQASRALRRQTRDIPEGILENPAMSSDAIDTLAPQERYAGETSIYEDIKDPRTFEMIRERVSIHGLIRPLEPESELDAFTVPEELIGTISERAIRRYVESEAHFRKKFAQTYKSIEKARKRNLERMERKESKRLEALRASRNNGSSASPDGSQIKIQDSVPKSPGWGYAWALDELEKPPPSSIAARRDTEEARKLAQIADQAMMEGTSELNANSLWSVMMNFLTPPDRATVGSGRKNSKMADKEEKIPDKEVEKEKGKEKWNKAFSQILLGRRGEETTSPS